MLPPTFSRLKRHLRNSVLALGCVLATSPAYAWQNGEDEEMQYRFQSAEYFVSADPQQPAAIPAPAPAAAQPDDEYGVRRLERDFFKNLAQDQKHIWTSPLRLRPKDAWWLAPAGALTGTLIHFDPRIFRHTQGRPSRAHDLRRFSDYGAFALGGTASVMYLMGRMKGNDHLRETGVLGAEAALNTIAVTYALKYPLGRERPYKGAGGGDFFSGGESFPSLHSATAWSLASVIAHEYPGPLTKLSVYGLASAVTAARVAGGRHFASDALVGSAIGWVIGRSVYRKRHHPDLPGANIGTFSNDNDDLQDHARQTGSPMVPLDSWIYPAFDRLSALAATRSDFLGIRPWSRMECARLLLESGELDSVEGESNELVAELKEEFTAEIAATNGTPLLALRFGPVYARFDQINGRPLADSYHLGQTVVNDFGRPYGEGFNAVAGASASLVKGRWAFYARGEYQHAARNRAFSAATMAFISDIDFTPLEAPRAKQQLDRFELVEAYASVNWSNWQLSFGRQAVWWGPSRAGSLMFSTNARPVDMFKLSRLTPAVLPPFLRWLGPFKADVFVGRLSGHRYTQTSSALFGPSLDHQPLIHGGKVAFKPSPNFEFGVSVTTIFAGTGSPLNARTVLRSFGLSNTVPGLPSDPGDRRSGFDFRYRVPFLRDRLTVYLDSFTEDEISPLGFPRRSAMAPGLYLSRLPFLKNVDFRAEGFYTDLPGLRRRGSYYFNSHYLNGYTNDGLLIGHWVGRQGSGFALASDFWKSATRKVGVSYRQAIGSQEFVPGGSRSQEWGAHADWRITRHLTAKPKLQYERWSAPSLEGRNSNFLTGFQLEFWPANPRR